MEDDDVITGTDLISRDPVAGFRPTSKALLRRHQRSSAVAIPEMGTEWAAHAARFATDFAKIHVDFTSEDLWLDGLAKPPNPREMGNVLTKLARAGVIEQAGKTRKSQLRHRTKLTVWKLVE